MARHETFTLDTETAAHARTVGAVLAEANAQGSPVALTVKARDTGAISYRTGTVESFSGCQGMSNDSVTLNTDKGFRTFNVWLISEVAIIGGAE